MKIKFFIAILALLCVVGSINAQDRTMVLNVDGVELDSLRVNFTLPPNKDISLSCTSVDKKQWRVNIPDSIFTPYFICMVVGKKVLEDDDIETRMFMFHVDTIKLNSIYFSDRSVIPVNLSCFKKEKYVSKSPQDAAIDGVLVCDVTFTEGTDSEVPLSILFSELYFQWAGLPEKEMVDNYKQLVSQYSDTYVLAKTVKMMIDEVEVENAQAIYNLFSDRVKILIRGSILMNIFSENCNSLSSIISSFPIGKPKSRHM